MAPTLGEDWRGILGRLKKNWDSYGAVPIAIASIVTIESISIVPTSIGGLQLEIHKDGFDLEMEVSPTGEIRNILSVMEKID